MRTGRTHRVSPVVQDGEERIPRCGKRQRSHPANHAGEFRYQPQQRDGRQQQSADRYDIAHAPFGGKRDGRETESDGDKRGGEGRGKRVTAEFITVSGIGPPRRG